MGDESGVASANFESFQIEATGATEDEILEAVSGKPKSDKEKAEERSEAASKLGKAGGKAAAEKRAKEEKAEEAESKKEAKPEEKDEAKPEEKGGEKPEKDEAKEDEKKAKSREDDPRHSARARVEQATRQAAEARRERDEAVARVQGLEARIAAIEGGAKPTAGEAAKGDGPSDDARPKIEDYDNWAKYEDDFAAWNRRQIVRELRQEREKEQAIDGVNRQLAGAINAFREAVGPVDERYSQEIRELTPEFQLQPNERPTAHTWLANEIIFSPESAKALMLHLSKNPEDYQAITALQSPRDVSRAVAKLEAKIEAETLSTSEPEKETHSEAEPPPKSVKGSAFVADTDPNPKPGEDFDTWRRRTKGQKK